MAQAYFSLVTTTGKIKLAESVAGGDAVVITHFAIGDGNGAETNPTAAATALVREVWRTPVESVVTDPDNPSAILVTAIIPTNAGGWWMREFGIFDQAGSMIAVAKPVSQYKPTALEGQLEDIRYEFQIIIGENANVTLLVDPSLVFATRAWVENRKVPMGQLMRLPWMPVLSMTLSIAPGNPAVGDSYLVPSNATGVWATNIGKIAEWNGSGWNYVSPPDGHGVSLPDGRIFERVEGAYVEKIALNVQSGKWNYAVAGGTAAAVTAAVSPAPAALVDGLKITVKPAISPAANATFNLNDLGAKQITGADGSPIRDGDIIANIPTQLQYSAVLDKWLLLTYPRLPSQALGVSANKLVSVNIPNNLETAVLLGTKLFDYSNGYNTETGIYTVPRSGIYGIAANFYFLDYGGASFLYLRRNGERIAEASANYRGRVLAAATHVPCVAGDQLSFSVVQLSGSTMTIDNSNNYTHAFSAVYLGTK